MKKKLISFITCACVILSTACAQKPEVSVEEVELPSVPVTVAAPAVSDIFNNVDFVGKVSTADTLNVFSRMQGIVKNIYVEKSDMVKKGDVILELDDKDIQTQIKQAKAAVSVAQANAKKAAGSSADSAKAQSENAIQMAQMQYDAAQSAYNTASELYAIEAIAFTEFEQAERGLNTALEQLNTATKSAELTEVGITEGKVAADAGVAQASVSLDGAKLQLSYTKVTAPQDGKISVLNAKVDEPVSSQNPVAVISIQTQGEVVFYIPSTYVPSLSVDQAVEVAAGVAVYEGSIKEIADLPNAQTGLYEVKVLLPEDAEPVGGSEVIVRCAIKESLGAITVPVRAVRTAADGSMFAFIAKDGVAVKVPVKQGIIEDTMMEVVEGIASTDKIILTDAPGLKDGATINVVEER